MTDQELAEKIAKLRGYEYRYCYFGDRYRMGWCHKDVDEGETWEKYPMFLLKDEYFLPMVREAEEKGWIVHWEDDLFEFQHEVTDSYGPDIDQITTSFEVKEHGHMKAMCLAWVEAMEAKQ